MSKTIYLAGKIDTGEMAIADLAVELEKKGHTVIEKWWKKGLLPKPYMQHLETSTPAASAMVDAAYNSDIFILLASDDILGAAVELGAAIASTKVKAGKQVVVVNPFTHRQSIFYAHEAVRAVRDIKSLYDEQWY